MLLQPYTPTDPVACVARPVIAESGRVIVTGDAMISDLVTLGSKYDTPSKLSKRMIKQEKLASTGGFDNSGASFWGTDEHQTAVIDGLAGKLFGDVSSMSRRRLADDGNGGNGDGDDAGAEAGGLFSVSLWFFPESTFVSTNHESDPCVLELLRIGDIVLTARTPNQYSVQFGPDVGFTFDSPGDLRW